MNVPTEHIQNFIDEHPNWSKNTVDRYRRALTLFLDEVENPAELTAAEFKRWLDKTEWGTASRYIAFQATRQFIEWMYGANHKALTLKVTRKESPPGRVLSVDQVKQLLSMHDTTTAKGWRDLSIAALMLDSGLRCSEVCDIQLKYLDVQKGKLQVIVKGGKWAPRIFGSTTANYIATWLDHRKTIAKEDYVFVSLGGNTPGNKITRDGLKQIFKYWGQRLGWLISPHDLRRTMASISTENGAPQPVVMAAGGWKSEEVFWRYTVGVKQESYRPYFVTNAVAKMKDQKDR